MTKPKTIVTVVLTGGPCAGKSSARATVEAVCAQEGWTPLFLSECATDLILGGIAPWTCETKEAYQSYQARLQLAKEAIYRDAAHAMADERILVVCDRGMADACAYMSKSSYEAMLASLGLDRASVNDRYDAVIHLVSASIGAEAAYGAQGNDARSETLEEARALDHATREAWEGHGALHVIGNEGDFALKMERLSTLLQAILREFDV